MQYLLKKGLNAWTTIAQT